jgi:hypothetical protein
MFDQTLFGRCGADPLSQKGDEIVQVSERQLLAGVGILERSPPTDLPLVLYLPPA